ncbi:hypothetical protein [Streptomyces xanthophaeus]|uniref:hypothetical protein n=1 Tax=Streptomyces xanthophaeus TaxID=67385 RepID=UPI002649BEED|nr:hypothetical protein [Streptomyces xanthophaeus]WKD37688.1 hypothetical protein KO717_26605 [Streptomyces xanthophaeus]
MSSVEEFRTGVRGWLRAHLTGEFAGLERRGGPAASSKPPPHSPAPTGPSPTR